MNAPLDHLQKAEYYNKPIPLSILSFPVMLCLLSLTAADRVMPKRIWNDPTLAPIAEAADAVNATMLVAYFWVGGTNTMNGTNLVLATTSGGTASVAAPGIADSVTFDGNSGGGAATIAINMNCATVTLNTGWTGTVAYSVAQTVSGVITHLQGTLNTNNNTVSLGSYTTSGSLVRTLAAGTSAITVTSGGSSWVATTITNMTVTGSPTVTFTGVTSSISFGGTTTFASWSIVLNSTGTTTFSGGSGSHTYTNFTYAPTAGTSNALTLSMGVTGNLIVSGTLSLSSTLAPDAVLIQSSAMGTACTITAAIVSLTGRVDFQDIIGAGAGSWNFSGGVLAGNCNGNSGIIFPSAKTNYWVGGTGNWSVGAMWASTSGGTSGSGRSPLPQDSAIFDVNSFTAGSQTCTLDCVRACGSVDWSAVTHNPTWQGSTNPITVGFYGSFVLGTMIMSTNRINPVMLGRGICQFDTKGTLFPNSTNLVFNGFGGTYQLISNLGETTATFGAITISGSCTLDNTINNVNVTWGLIQSTTGPVKLGGGTWTVAGVGAAWSASTAAITAGTSTIIVAYAGSGTAQFIGGAHTYYIVEILSAGTGIVQVTGANTFDTFLSNGGLTIQTASGTTQIFTGTVAGHGLQLNGATLTSSTPGTQYTFQAASSVVVSVTNSSITDCAAAGTAIPFVASGTSSLSNSPNWNLLRTKTQNAVSRIVVTATKTQTATARISKINTLIQTAVSRVQKISTKTQPATSRIQNVLTQTQTVISRIQIIGTRIQTAIARIQKTSTKTQLAISRIQTVVMRLQTSLARIRIIGTNPQPSTARIQRVSTKPQTATSRIQVTAITSRTALSRMQNHLTVQETSIARVQTNLANHQTGVARIVTGDFRVWTGTTWVVASSKVFNGSDWVMVPVKKWTGLVWESI